MGGSAKRIVMPPVDVTEHMKKIDSLRRDYIEGRIEKEIYTKNMAILRKELEEIQKKGF